MNSAAAEESQCDLLEQLVRFDPTKRPSAFQALRHPYLDDLHDEDAAELKVERAGALRKLQGENVYRFNVDAF